MLVLISVQDSEPWRVLQSGVSLDSHETFILHGIWGPLEMPTPRQHPRELPNSTHPQQPRVWAQPYTKQKGRRKGNLQNH